MRLGDLAPHLPMSDRMAEVEIRGLAIDSREVEPGFLFAGLPGSQVDGMTFAATAAQRGAAAILGPPTSAHYPGGAIALKVTNPRQEIARIAARFFGRQPKVIAAVTGTAGKTSVAEFLRQIWRQCGHRNSASIGTLGIVRPDGETYGSLTTPDPIELQRNLAELQTLGVDHLAMEASSHGLDQYRLDGVRLAAAAFTNLGRDHMDYHPTIEDYLSAKARLFTELLPEGAPAILDMQAPYAAQMAAICQRHGRDVRSVGKDGSFLRLISLSVDLEGARQRLTVEAAGQTHDVMLPLIGGFQVSNALIAAGLAASTGVPAADALAALSELQGAAGRLQLIGETRQVRVFVDYAHKPDAVREILTTLREVTSGALAIVLGAGGDRDAGKRPLMGEAAGQGADRVYVTDDNPRSENPAEIRRAILEACPGGIEIGDRAQAIRQAISDAQPGDVVVVAGKGHEPGQIVGDTVLPFSDIDVVEMILSESEVGG